MMALPEPTDETQAFARTKRFYTHSALQFHISVPTHTQPVDLCNRTSPPVLILMTNAFLQFFAGYTSASSALLNFITTVNSHLCFMTQETGMLMCLSSPGRRCSKYGINSFLILVYGAIHYRSDCSSQQDTYTKALRNLVLTYFEDG